MPESVLLTQTMVQNINKLAFPPFQKDCRSYVTDLQNIIVLMSVWN